MDLEQVYAVVDSISEMDLDKVTEMTSFIKSKKLKNILELRFSYGASSCYIASSLDEMKNGHLTTIVLELARNKQPNIESVLKKLGLFSYVTIYHEPTSYNWRLMKLIERNSAPTFDLCYINGVHDWFNDGFAFFLVDKLLVPGGWIIFDDINLTFNKSPSFKNSEKVQKMPFDERNTAHVRKIYELLVKTHPSYHNFVEKGNWVYAQKNDGISSQILELKKIFRKDELIENYDNNSIKGESELHYWLKTKENEGNLSNDHYEYFYTTFFGLDKDYFNGKKILDIGCGPRGSLEWADMAKERIGLDPLADDYVELGTDKHNMNYVSSGSEHIPFFDNYFDVVCSFNSLDHVDNLEKSISEIKRVLKVGGLFLLLTDVNHEPTECEPISFSFNITEKFKPFKVLDERHYEKSENGLYQSIHVNVPYDHDNAEKRYGILAVKFKKVY
ncbi:hypothetical protein BK009_06250 [Methanobacterium subterraneum]|uniref:Methyltransferase type 11 domain-containing protein n=1 Tax=Methanobacterium subterraneum TaxID=59277 RepID=A0A2H4VQG7_9EURY|nr:methyltransferase domain-containing protein [Methanobacterium subterraneum]AUB60321.1 hypothetical protein BK009_06250 [Methanobacterium subterraneum]